MTTVTCDRCGKNARYHLSLTALDGGKDMEVFWADLCPECAATMKHQITNLEVTDLAKPV